MGGATRAAAALVSQDTVNIPKITAAGCLCLALVGLTSGQSRPASQPSRPPEPAQSLRSARLDAITKLIARIESLRINRQYTVAAVLQQVPQARVQLCLWVSALGHTEGVTLPSERTRRVTIQLDVVSLSGELKRICRRRPEQMKITPEQFDKIGSLNKVWVIRATGAASAGRSQWLEMGQMVLANQSNLMSIEHLKGSARSYWVRRVGPAGRAAAVRAGRADAMRRLVDRIRAVYVTPKMNLGDFVAACPAPPEGMEVFLPAARVTGICYRQGAPVVSVEVQVPLRTVYLALNSWIKASGYAGAGVLEHLQQLDLQTSGKIITDTGVAVPPAEHLQQLVLQTSGKIITEIGVAVPPAEHLKDLSIRERLTVAAVRHAPSWIALKKRAVGVDELQARRKLAKDIGRLEIALGATVADFVASDRDRCVALVDYLQQGELVGPGAKTATAGPSKVTVEIPLKDLWDLILFYVGKGAVPVAASAPATQQATTTPATQKAATTAPGL